MTCSRSMESPRGFDLLIIDIDFNDFWVWQQIDHEKYRPRIVIIEYNGNIPIGESRVVKRNDTHVWSDSSYCGASLLAMQRLGMSLGYSLVYAESHGVNAFFVRTDVLNRHFRPEQMSCGGNRGNAKVAIDRTHLQESQLFWQGVVVC